MNKRFFVKYIFNIRNYSPILRLSLLFFSDFLAIIFSSILPLLVYTGSKYTHLSDYLWIVISLLVFGSLIYLNSQHYKSFTRYIDSKFLYVLILKNILLILIVYCIGFFANLPLPEFSFWILVLILLCSTIGFSRLLQRDLLLILRSNNSNNSNNCHSIAIFGSGMAGVLLYNSLKNSSSTSIYTFVDDNPTLYSKTINGIPICSFNTLKKFIYNGKIDKVMLAIPSIKKTRLREIIKELKIHKVKVLQVPSVSDITSGRANIDSLRPLDVEDLLGRPTVDPDFKLLGNNIKNRSICVTGAGGSIGSELCRQIIEFNPKCLIMLDNSEIGLYSIQDELINNSSIERIIVPLLCDVCDYGVVKRVFKKYSVEVVFHAAAYKHVPLFQSNYLVGLSNNINSTRNLANLVSELEISQMVLISSDKAVRPSNMMGVSKRISELIVKSFSEPSTFSLKKNSPKYSMVRFGNVLGSSGSVVPLFMKQIEAGGPITLTDKNIIRYFMTIKEASQLVLQSSVLAKGGDLFLLDMGEPVKIYDLASQMVRLSGLSIKDEKNPDGDIEIVITGLRPGEKLYEELLITGSSVKTLHPLIYKANEDDECISSDQLNKQLDLLKLSIDSYNKEEVLKIISQLVPEWNSKEFKEEDVL
tara:strand:- start:3517 stop:5448 length:1932 start_codon:yes stop_codon:yes gene_type:complete